MLYVFMALYAEAAPFIAQMKLKRVNDSGKFVTEICIPVKCR